jgi:hypothetical protein
MGLIKGMHNRLVCLVVRHDWTAWRAVEVDGPAGLIRDCRRCGRLQTKGPRHDVILPLPTRLRGDV